MKANLPITCSVSLLLAACSSGASLTPTPSLTPNQGELMPGIHKVALSGPQMAVVESSVQSMLQDQSTASFSGVNAIFVDTLAAIQVCGTVTPTAQRPLPFYLELIDKDGKSEAKRGQIGSTPSKLAKVRFMCRRNGNI